MPGVPSIHKLSQEHQQKICQLIAIYTGPKQILEFVKENWGFELNHKMVTHYANSDNWKPYIDRFRYAWDSNLAEHYLTRKRARIIELEKVLRQIQDERTQLSAYARIKLTLETLQQVADEVSGKVGQKIEVNFNQVQLLTDEDLEREIRDGIEKIKLLRRDFNAKSKTIDAEATDTPGADPSPGTQGSSTAEGALGTHVGERIG